MAPSCKQMREPIKAYREGQEGDSIALLASAPCAPNAVSVILNAVRHVVVDDAGDVLDVNAAPCHVCGHQDRVLALLEPGQPCFTLILQHKVKNSPSARVHCVHMVKEEGL